MRILPQDLGPRWHVALIQRRCHIAGAHGEEAAAPPRDAPTPRMGFWGRLWAQGSGLEPERAAAVLPAAGPLSTEWVALSSVAAAIVSLFGTAIFLMMGLGPAGVAAAFAAGGILAGGGACFGPGFSFRRTNAEGVKPGEIDQLLERCDDELARAFLTLARDAARLEAAPAAEESVRSALAALAEAMERLPVIAVEPVDTAALHAEAEELRAAAARERDPVTSGSLERRARAVLVRAETHEQTALVSRRAAALRAEVRAQIEAMREGLAAQQAPGGETGALVMLAEAARQVATEAAGVAAARTEVEALSTPLPALPEQEPRAAIRRG